MEALWRDLLLTVRLLGRSPIFAVAAALTLALGVASNVAVFSVVNALILRPLPVRDADRLVVLATKERSSRALQGVSFPDVQDYRAATPEVFEDVAAYSVGFVGLAIDGGRSERVLVTWVTGNYFSLLDLEPSRGRLIRSDEARSGHTDPIVVLGYAAWQRRFGGDPAVVGKTVRVNGQLCTIVGIAPSGFHGTFAFSDSELYLPLNWLGVRALEDRGRRGFHAFARLPRDVSIARAQAAMDLVAERLMQEHPVSNEERAVQVLPERLARPEEDQARVNMWGATILLILVGLVMALAGANVISLLLARASHRRHELAIRASLGAGRGTLLRQMAIEGLLIAALGATAGILIGTWAAHTLDRLLRLPGDLPVRFDFGMDWRVVTYAVVVALGTGLVVSLVAAAGAVSAIDLTLRQSNRRSPAGAGGGPTRTMIVVVQVAACFVLLVAAGLLVRSLWAAERADLGFNPAGVLNVHVDVGQLGYTEAEGRAFFDDVERRVRALPGVDTASFAFTLPMGYIRVGDTVEAEGVPTDVGRLSAGKNIVSPEHFETMDIRIVRGRRFDVGDDERSRPVAIVNRRFAESLWPDQDAVGRRFRSADGGGAWVEIVGVTETGKYRFLFEDPQPYFYVPIAQEYTPLRVLQVRTALTPEALAPAIERVVLEREPNLPVYDVQSMTRALGSGLGFFPVRVGAASATTLGLLGLALAIVGVYGLVAQATVRRRREIGVRLALGATSRDVFQLVLTDGLKLLVLGLGAGLMLMLGGGGILERFLFGVSSRDAATFAVVSTILAAVTIAACAVPAWQATRVDPTVALRAE